MLSFIKDQNSGEPSKSEQDNEPKSGFPTASDEQEYIEVATNKERVRKSTVILFVLVAIGLAFLVFMIKKSTPSEASASSVSEEELKIEKAISELTGIKSEMNSNMDAIVRKFYEFSDVEQVGVTELAKNPFRHKISLVGLENLKDSDNEGQAELFYQQLRQQAENMELLSVMRSDDQRCCMINDAVLFEGDAVGLFTIKEIGDDFVKLLWINEAKKPSSETEVENLEIILSLSD